MTIDLTTDHGKRVVHQLQHEAVIWLTTVGTSGTPQPNPVWFHYMDGDIYVYNQPDAVRLKNIAANNRVSLNFNTSEDGEQVTVITGTAAIDEQFPKVAHNPDYCEKYAESLVAINSSPEKMSREYPVVLRITPEKLRGW